MRVGLVTIVLFFVALIPRLIGLDRFLTTDENYFVFTAGSDVIAAFLRGDLRETYWHFYPGVTLSWLDALGMGVECLAELHNVHAVLTQRGSDGRRRICLAGRDLQLDVGVDFLCHNFAPGITPTRPQTSGISLRTGRCAADADSCFLPADACSAPPRFLSDYAANSSYGFKNL